MAKLVDPFDSPQALGFQTSAGRPAYGSSDGVPYSEKTVTFQAADGSWVNAPSVMEGGRVEKDQGVLEELYQRTGYTDPITGKPLQRYATVEEAVAAAEQHSKSLIPEQTGLVDPFDQAPAFQPPAPQAAPPQPEKSPSYLGGLAQEGLQGATLGWSDEIQAILGSLGLKAYGALMGERALGPNPITGESMGVGDLYDMSMADQKQDMDQFRTENPKAAIAANIATGLATGGAMLKGGQAALGAVRGALGAQTGARTAQAIQGARTGFAAPAAAPGIPGAIGTGAAIGGIAGAGTADSGERLEGAIEGSLLGALLGGGAATIGSGVSAIWRKMAPGARDRLGKLAKASGLTPAQIQTRLTALGPSATIADVSQVFRSAADVAASRLGPTAKRVQELIRRDETQFSRLLDPIKRTLGSQDQAINTVSQLKDIRMQLSSPLYERAFKRGIQITENLDDLLSRPQVQKAWKQIQIDGASDPKVNISLFKQGAKPSMRGLQEITEELWDKAQSLSRKGRNKRAGILKDLRQAILDEMDAQSDDFRQARALWAGTKQADEALETGMAFFKQPIDEIRESLKKMSDSDRAFYRLGVGRAIEDRLAKSTDTNDLTRILRTPEFRQKVQAVMPKEAAVDFINTIRAEAMKKATANQVGRGSQTQPRQVAAQQLGGAPIGAEDFSKTGLINRVLGGVGAPREATIQEIGELLLSQNPATQAQAIRMMQNSQTLPRFRLGGVGAGATGGATTALGRRP